MALLMIQTFFEGILNLPVLFYYAVFGLACGWYLWFKQRVPGNAPPFPIQPLPIVGHLLALTPQRILETFNEWRNKVGDVYSIQLGSRTSVVINSWEPLKEAFLKKGEYFAERPDQSIVVLNQIETTGSLKGILFNKGPNWKEQRSVSIQILRKFGMGANWLAENIAEEVQVYINTLSKLKGQPSDPRMLTMASVSNVICAILIGQRFDLDDPYFVTFIENLNEAAKVITNVSILRAFPSLRHLPGDLFKAKKLARHEREFIKDFSLAFIQKAKESKMDNFITAYLAEFDRKQKQGSQTSLDEVNLVYVINELFAAGSETTSTTILWALLFAIHYPKTQEKCFQEIMEHVGADRLPNIQDKDSLNYVNAYIMESQRMGSVIPLGGDRKCTQTVEVGGYTIPAGTQIIPNLHAILHDEKTWGDPLVFRPERFLDENNKVFVPDQFVPFSIGRRYCMGLLLARMELYIFITSIFQRFHVLPDDPSSKLPSLESVVGLTNTPQPFSVRLEERGEFAEE